MSVELSVFKYFFKKSFLAKNRGYRNFQLGHFCTKGAICPNKAYTKYTYGCMYVNK